MSCARRVAVGVVITAWTAVSMGSAGAAEVPSGPSEVSVQGTQLRLRKRQPDGSLDAPKPYIIKGVTWSPSTHAPASGPNPLDPAGTDPAVPDTVPYGFFFDWPGRNPQGHVVLGFWQRTEHAAHAQLDLALMQQMHVNTVRVYADFGEDPGATAVLNECYARGIMVIMTVAASRADLEAGRHLATVQRHRNHPAILLWSLGNEWNFNRFFGYDDMDAAIAAVRQAAQAIHQLDPAHPVASSLGDRFSTEATCNPATDPCCGPIDAHSDIPFLVQAMPEVDVWGLNVYRGASFGALIEQWTAVTGKPLYLGEFGTDSFNSQTARVVNCGQADDVTGADGQPQQAGFVLGLWQELLPRLSALQPEAPVLGGCVHEWNDELWKVGSFHVGLGGLVPYDGPDGIPGTADDDTSYDEYNEEGFRLPGAHPDDVANEERFGVVDADRVPKDAFGTLQEFYGGLSLPPVLAAIGDRTVAEGQLLTFTASAVDPDGDAVTYAAGPLPAGASLDAASGAFAWTPGFSQAGGYPLIVTASDGAMTDSEPITITVADTPVPDLLLTVLTSSVSAVAPDASFSMKHTIANQGAAAAGSFAVAFHLSSDPVFGGPDDAPFSKAKTISSLKAGGSTTASITLTVPVATPLGPYYVCAAADAGAAVQESNEANNTRCTSSPIQVTRPDLVLTRVSGPSSAVRGGSLAITTTVRNQGAVKSPASAVVGLYLSTDAAITSSDRRIGSRSVSRLPPGATHTRTTTVTVPTTMAPGTYFLGAIVDETNRVTETDEDNNGLAGNPVAIQ